MTNNRTPSPADEALSEVDSNYALAWTDCNLPPSVRISNPYDALVFGIKYGREQERASLAEKDRHIKELEAYVRDLERRR